MVDLAQQRTESGAVVLDSTHRNAAEIYAVIAALATDQPHPFGLAASDMVGPADLERRLGGLAARIDEEGLVEAGRKHGLQRLGGPERERVAHLERRRIVELR